MNWYYVESGNSVGPIAEDQLMQLIRSAKITPDTLVWHEGMAEWKPCREAGPAAALADSPLAPSAVAAPEGHRFCAQCGNSFPEDDMMKYENLWVCVNCKPLFLQKLKEGVRVSTGVLYGGFWIRLGAKIIDGILLQIINYMLILPVFAFAGLGSTKVFGAIWFLQFFISMLVPIVLTTFFVGKFGATPGKMACRLKIVTAEGGKVTYLRAFARYWGEVVSQLTFSIGYLLAAWDDEKRALHDRICNTRVVRIP